MGEEHEVNQYLPEDIQVKLLDERLREIIGETVSEIEPHEFGGGKESRG